MFLVHSLSDNGPHYHNTGLLVYLAEVSSAFNLTLVEYNNFEAGEGKTVLDTFCSHKPQNCALGSCGKQFGNRGAASRSRDGKLSPTKSFCNNIHNQPHNWLVSFTPFSPEFQLTFYGGMKMVGKLIFTSLTIRGVIKKAYM